MYVCSIRRLIKVGEMSVFDTYSNFNTNKTQSTTSLDGYLGKKKSFIKKKMKFYHVVASKRHRRPLETYPTSRKFPGNRFSLWSV